MLFDRLISIHYPFLFITSVPDDFGPDISESLRGQRNGLCGGAVPGALYMGTGTHTGEIPVRVVLYETPPPLADWEEIVEVSFRPETPDLTLRSFDDAAELLLPVNDYRARWSATRMDAGKAQGVPDHEHPAVDRYELAFWPEPPSPDSIVRVTGVEAAYAHREQAAR